MLITSSIVTYKTDKEELAKCFQSLINSPISQIYVCDNSPTDELKTFCSSYEKVTYIFNNANLGYGAGHNVALRRALDNKVDYHLVINTDVYFDVGVIENIVSYMESNKDIGQLIPNVIYPDGRLQYVCRLLPTPLDLVFRRFLPPSFSRKINNRFLLKFDDHKKIINAPFHMGCFLFMRMSALEKIGLFDESIFMYTEDIDITRRMHKYYRTIYYPEVTIIHAHRAASYKNKKMLKIHIKSAIRYFNKWGWFFDRERRIWNKEVLRVLNFFK